MKPDYFATQRERKGWEYGVGDMVYVVDDDNKIREMIGEPCFGTIGRIDDLLVEIILNTSFGGSITVSIDNVWRVGEGPVTEDTATGNYDEEIEDMFYAEEPKTKDRFDLEQAIMNCWNIVDELKYVPRGEYEASVALDGLEVIYNKKFHEMFEIFETLISEGKLK